MIRWLKNGAGIAYAPLMWVIEEIKRGEIEILFKSYHSIRGRSTRSIPGRTNCR